MGTRPLWQAVLLERLRHVENTRRPLGYEDGVYSLYHLIRWRSLLRRDPARALEHMGRDLWASLGGWWYLLFYVWDLLEPQRLPEDFPTERFARPWRAFLAHRLLRQCPSIWGPAIAEALMHADPEVWAYGYHLLFQVGHYTVFALLARALRPRDDAPPFDAAGYRLPNAWYDDLYAMHLRFRITAMALSRSPSPNLEEAKQMVYNLVTYKLIQARHQGMPFPQAPIQRIVITHREDENVLMQVQVVSTRGSFHHLYHVTVDGQVQPAMLVLTT